LRLIEVLVFRQVQIVQRGFALIIAKPFFPALVPTNGSFSPLPGHFQ
jgi:hypothetical protein